MESFLLVVHVIIALVIVGLIMLQQGKGAEMGASFGGGGSQTVFGAAGSGNFFSRLTGVLVAVFFATSVVLAVLSKESGAADQFEVPVVETTDSVGDIPVEPSMVPTDDVPATPMELQSDEPQVELPSEQ